MIFDLIKKDHDEFRFIWTKIKDLDGDQSMKKNELFESLKSEIICHSKAEEKEFYQRLSEKEETKDIILHSKDEHSEIEAALNELSLKDSSLQEWQESFDKMIASLEEHIRDEEDELFPRAKKILGEVEEKRIGQNFTRAKEEIKNNMEDDSKKNDPTDYIAYY